MTLHFDAVICDLDGVVTRTARIHAAAWKELFDGFLRRNAPAEPPFDDVDYHDSVDGKPREEGVRSFLASRGIDLPAGDPSDPPDAETISGLGNRKNELFARILERDGVEVDAAAVRLLRELRERGVRTAVASSSRNCRRILERAKLEDLFDVRVDGEDLAAAGLPGKPAPDLFLETARRLGVEPSRAVVIEDAVAGTEAGRAGGFGLVVGVDRDGRAIALRERGADWVVGDLSLLDPDRIDAWFAHRGERRPSAIACWKEIESRLAGRRFAVFLDYDGTLTPIVDRPEDAHLGDAMREALRRLSAVAPTVVVSGRGREDVAGRVGLPNLHYAGSHGFDITGPGGLHHEVDPSLRPVVERVFRRLSEAADGISGAIVEDKRFSVAVHYRLAAAADVPRLEKLVDEAIAGEPQLRKAHGKKVFEVRPSLEWDKGRALLWLVDTLGLDDAVPIYVGDDTTDEDAFAVLRGRGVAVLVADAPRPTAADHWVQDVPEVRELLERLAQLS